MSQTVTLRSLRTQIHLPSPPIGPVLTSPTRSTWTGVGATSFAATGPGTDPSKSRSKFGLSRGVPSSGFTNSRSQTSTFASDTQDAHMSSSFGHLPKLSVGIGGNKFSNRQATTAVGETSEEWEMEIKKGDEAEVALESPTASGSGGMGSEVEVGVEGDLNRPAELGKVI